LAGCWSNSRVVIADGGEAIEDIDMLRHRRDGVAA
jgi:hypothetical protein